MSDREGYDAQIAGLIDDAILRKLVHCDRDMLACQLLIPMRISMSWA